MHWFTSDGKVGLSGPDHVRVLSMVAKHRYVGVRLGIAFGVLVVLLVIVGWLGLYQMGRINRDLEAIVNERWAKEQLTREALDYSNQNNRITMELFFLEDKAKIDPLLLQRLRNTEKITAIVQKLELQVEAGQERELLDSVQESRGPYISSYLRGLHLLLDEHRYAEARANVVQDTLP